MSNKTKLKNKAAKFFYSDEEWLRKHYIEMQLSALEIAKLLDCNYDPIYTYLKKFGIPTRKTMSDKSKKLMSEKQKENWKNPECRRKHEETYGNRVCSEGTRKKISDAAKLRCSDPEYRKMMSEVQKRYVDEHPEVRQNFANRIKLYKETHPEWINPMQRPEVVAKISGDNNYLRQRPEAREEISKRDLIMWSDSLYKERMSGPNSYNYGRSPAPGSQWSKGLYFTKLDDTKIWMRSTYEYRVAEILTYYKINWLHEPSAFPVDELGTWRPDFYLPDYDLWWEIKGYVSKEASLKISKFLDLYHEKQLKILFLLDIEELECYKLNNWKFDVSEIGTEAELIIYETNRSV